MIAPSPSLLQDKAARGCIQTGDYWDVEVAHGVYLNNDRATDPEPTIADCSTDSVRRAFLNLLLDCKSNKGMEDDRENEV